MYAVEANDPVAAWNQAVARLLAVNEENHLIVQINQPSTFDAQWPTRFNPKSCKPNGDALSDVINTVFPWRLATKCGNRNELYRRYRAYHARSLRMRRHPGTWGTYFSRLLEFGPAGPNQLETVITKLTEWQQQFKAAFTFHPTGPHLDAPRTRGGPCWHYGQLLGQPNGDIDFFVVYRNHDYFNKALGNFLALGQLHRFICMEAGKRQGKLVCHSAHAYFDSSKLQLQALLAR